MRKWIIAAVTAGAVFAGGAGTALAVTSGTRLQTVSQTETIVNSRCYTTHKVTSTNYRWSTKTGWTKYPSPKVTTTNSETCH
jgi:hypothetical protein